VTTTALTLITYVWHYLVARLAYDELVRPLIHGQVPWAPLICVVAAGAFLIGWRVGRRPAPPRRQP